MIPFAGASSLLVVSPRVFALLLLILLIPLLPKTVYVPQEVLFAEGSEPAVTMCSISELAM